MARHGYSLYPLLHPPTFLKDLGSGNGFMLPATVFYYSGRRSFLYDDDDHEHCRLDPPIDFMCKSQVRKLQRLVESKTLVIGSRKVRSIRWVHIEDISSSMNSMSMRPLTTGDLPSQSGRKIYGNNNLEKSSSSSSNYAVLLRVGPPTKPRQSLARSEGGGGAGAGTAAGQGGSDEWTGGSSNRRVTSINVSSSGGGGGGGGGGGAASTNNINRSRTGGKELEEKEEEEEWEELFQAGVHFYYSVRTGEYRETRPVASRRKSVRSGGNGRTGNNGGITVDQANTGGGGRPINAPACMEGGLSSSSRGNSTMRRDQPSQAPAQQQQQPLEAEALDGEDGEEQEEEELVAAVVMIQQQQQEAALGMGAPVYDPTELYELLDYLEGKKNHMA